MGILSRIFENRRLHQDKELNDYLPPSLILTILMAGNLITSYVPASPHLKTICSNRFENSWLKILVLTKPSIFKRLPCLDRQGKCEEPLVYFLDVFGKLRLPHNPRKWAHLKIALPCCSNGRWKENFHSIFPTIRWTALKNKHVHCGLNFRSLWIFSSTSSRRPWK